MSERPEADKVETPKPATPPERPKTVEKPGTGSDDSKTDPDGGKEKPKGSSSFYGRDEYPDGYVMHHEQSGAITLDNPDGSRGRWNADERQWVDMAGHPMPEGWEGGHQPGTAFDSGKSANSPY